MADLNRRMPSVNTSHFALVPRTDIPRSNFGSQHSVKTTINAGALVPFHIDEVLPGDHHKGRLQIFARLATLLFPLMDNVELETFFFFCPCRLVWTNWEKFQGEQVNPGDSISYTIPVVPSPAGGFAVASIYDYFGLPTVGQVAGGAFINPIALPLRAYNLIYNEWFRDEDLDPSLTVPLTDGPDSNLLYGMQNRRKKHDYFTSCRPWPLKGGANITFPIGGTVNVTPIGNSAPLWKKGAGPTPTGILQAGSTGTPTATLQLSTPTGAWAVGDNLNWLTPNLQVDLSTATGANVNAMRIAMATQQLLEKDARGGTRYTESLRNIWGVTPDDARMQRPEYIGGGRSRVQTQAMPNTNLGSTPLGSLAGAGVVNDSHSFAYHATEHGYIIGLINVRADLTYQQGMRRLWTRSTRYDLYTPLFANLGEQVVRNDEIYCDGSANDILAFGYQERWGEYRYFPSLITGLFKSRSAGTIDPWHLAQNFASLPALNSAFVIEGPPLSRVLAAGGAAANMQILVDSFWELNRTRPMPVYSVPGLTRF